jgi:hypothetical protein
MKIINDDIWNYATSNSGGTIVIPTNGSVNRYNLAVMGRGLALEASQCYPKLREELGFMIIRDGNRLHYLPQYKLLAFPVKHSWSQPANLKLIELSARELALYMDNDGIPLPVYMPKVGCGPNTGRRQWYEVKPILQRELGSRAYTIVNKSLT